MYYVSILHRVPYTTVEYTTETYFIDEVAADNWIDKIFMPHEFHPLVYYSRQRTSLMV